MKREAKKYTVTIFGDSYSLVSDESEEALLEAVKMVDQLMNELSETFKSTEVPRIAVLAALQIAHRFLVHQSCVTSSCQDLADSIDQQLTAQR